MKISFRRPWLQLKRRASLKIHKLALHTAHNNGYTLRPAGLPFGTFGGAERRIAAERCE